jgi:hypothetical protein
MLVGRSRIPRWASTMSIATPDRIIELWPCLSDEARQRLLDLAELSASRDVSLPLSDEEERLLADMDAFMERLRREAGPAT